ncbi:MAG: YigZ family protein [Thermoflexibacter sp.]
MDTYFSIKQETQTIYKEKGSKFLAFAFPVENEEAIKEHLSTLRKKYYDATHHCYAYLLGKEKKVFRAYDDGEPNGTAGLPILNQIRSKEITNVLVVVVRYFGGTKLGASGLINAYKTASAEVLAQAEVVEKILTQTLQIHFDYHLTNEVMKLIKENEATIEKQTFEDRCKICLRIREKQYDNLVKHLRELKNVEVLTENWM